MDVSFSLYRESLMSKIENGNTIGVHYIGTLEDGTVFDSSRNRGNPLVFKVGSNQVITGFDKAVVGMKLGETKNISISPTQAYGESKPNLFRKVPKTTFPDGFVPKEGALVEMVSPSGKPMPATIASFTDNNVTLDFNHPLSGKVLNFEIEVVESIDSKVP